MVRLNNTGTANFKRGITFCLGLAIFIFCINLALTIWSCTGEATDEGTRVLQQGSCRSASRTNTAVHVLINALSAVLLAASNYCMQICIAPSRADIDKAHASRRWLSIGVPSLRNFNHVSPLRRACWALLCISSLPLHLIYNSTIFQTLVTNEYAVGAVDESFLWPNTTYAVPEELINVGIIWQADDTMRIDTNATARENAFISMLTDSPTWDNLTLLECARIYSQPLLATHRTLVLVTSHNASITDNPFEFYYVGAGNNGWMCGGDDYYSGNDLNTPTTLCSPSQSTLAKAARQPRSPGTPMYCLAQPLREECTLEVSRSIAIGVCVANLIKVIVISVVLLKATDTPMVTLGDAIASFIQVQDASVRGLSAEDCKNINAAWERSHPGPPWGRTWESRVYRLWHCVSKGKRILSVVAVAVSLIAISILLAMAVRADSGRGTDFTGNTFLSKPPNVIIGYESLAGLSLSAIVILVNLPQLICSLLYFYYNALLTAFCQAKEWNAFALAPQTVRVSCKPRGQQKSAYYLSLPFRFAIPLLLLSGLLHWLISQTIFMLKVTFKSFDGGPSERFGGAGYGYIYGDHPGELLTSSYNTQGIMYCLITAVIAYTVLFAIGCQRLKGDMVIAGTSSAVIAAACLLELDFEPPRPGYQKKASTEVFAGVPDDKWAEGELMWGDFGQTVRCVGHMWEEPSAGHLRLGRGIPVPPVDGWVYT